MINNFHTINFQDLKKFLTKRFSKSTYISNNKDSACEDSKSFGSAYHKVLEQDPERIRSIIQKKNSYELEKLIGNFKLNSKDKNTLLSMIKKIYLSSIYQKYVLRAKFIHSEQNICHFITEGSYIFRLEAIVDSIISIDGKKKIILDYKTINDIRLVDKTTDGSFYWIQLLFYKYIYQNSVQSKSSGAHDKVEDLYLLFQSKSKSDDYQIVIKKFSDLSIATRKTLERDFQIALHEYIKYIIKNKQFGSDFKLPSSSEIEEFRRKNKGFDIISCVKYFFRSSVKSIFVGVIFGLLWIFYHSKYFIFDEKFTYYGLGIFVFWGLWFTLKK